MATRGRDIAATSKVGRDAGRLLLEILDLPYPAITSAALGSRREAKELIKAGLLVPAGQEPVVPSEDRDETPVTLQWSARHGSYGYFSTTRGWISVSEHTIAVYRADIATFLSTALAQLGVQHLEPLSAGTDDAFVWDAGHVRLPKRTYRVPVWFVRCCAHASAWSEIRDLALARPPERTRVLIASTPRDRLPAETPPRHLLVSMEDMVVGSDTLVLDSAVLAARLSAPAFDRRAGSPLLVEADGRYVMLNGKAFRFRKGDRQPAIVLYLYQRYLEGELTVSVARLAEDIGLSAKSRIRDNFKGPAGRLVMTELLFEKGGMCGFRLDETPE